MRDCPHKSATLVRSRWNVARSSVAIFAASALSLLIVSLSMSLSLAQPPADDPETGEDERPKPAVEEVEPEVFWLKNKDGKYIKVIGVPYERIKGLLQKESGTSDGPPPFALDKANCQGEIRESHCPLTLDFSIRVREAGWVKVPLKLHGLALRSELRYEGPTEAILSYENGVQGYAVWIRGGDAGVHRLAIDAVAAIEGSSGEKQLQFDWPRATESTLSISAPGTIHDPALGSGEGQLTSRVEGDKTLIQVLAGSGKLAIGWKDRAMSATPGRNGVEVRCDVLWRIENPQIATGEASMAVRSLAGTTSRTLVVRLPSDSQWTPTTQPAWRAERLAFSDVPPALAEFVPDSLRGGEFLRLALEPETADWPAEIRLGVVAKPTTGEAGSMFSLDGFDILGAVRQRGSVEVLAPSSMNVRCVGDESVLRNEATGTNPQGDVRSAGSYRFGSQPFRLTASAVAQQARITCEPSYVATIENNQAVLEASFRFRVRGVRDTPLTIDFGEWIPDSVAPPEAQVPLDESAEPATGNKVGVTLGAGRDMTIRVTARKPIVEGRIEFDAPRLDGVTLAPATWTLRPDANILITPNEKELRGLTPEVRPATVGAVSNILAFRETSAGGPPHFSGSIRLATKRLAIARQVGVNATRDGFTIDETWMAKVSYGSVDNLLIRVPADATDLTVLLEGEPVPVESVDLEGVPHIRIGIAKAQSREFRLRLGYRYPFPKLDESTPSLVELPLAKPAFDGDLRWSGAQGFVEWTGPFSVAIAGRSGVRPTMEANRRPRLPVAAGDLKDSLTVTISALANATRHRTTVPQAWMQTWLAAGSRRDRIVWRIVTDQPSVTLELSPSALVDSAFLLDGRPVAAGVGNNQLTIDLPAKSTSDSSYVLEAWILRRQSETEAPSSLTGSGEFEFPLAVDGSRPNDLIWHLSTPDDQTLVATPSGFSPEMGWAWPFPFRRGDSQSTTRVRTWIGAATGLDDNLAPPDYAFRSFDVPATSRVRIVATRWLAALVAVAVFGSIWLGLRLRHALGWVLFAAFAIGGLALLQTTLFAPVAAAAALLGVAAACVRGIGFRIAGVHEPQAAPAIAPLRPTASPSRGTPSGPKVAARREAGSSRIAAPGPAVVASTEAVDVQP